ncbi:hypothetical protein KFK09_003056 [Dendrobium nobile]|uniref:Uncharacterized protein n=1 Tax=Dendrobium nobile TaxID=94219 RepID=A0A8T3C6L8_DENNO|nr:hypothetical protein KFK09_003056 [Dendrobium nobile]
MDPYRILPYRIILLIFFFFLLRLHEGWATAVQGGQFATGSIQVGGLELREHTTFTKIWTAVPLNSSDSSATFFSPSSLPSGFFPLGSHAQPHTPNPSPPRALIARDTSNSLASPTDFTVLFSSNFSSPSPVFFWLPYLLLATSPPATSSPPPHKNPLSPPSAASPTTSSNHAIPTPQPGPPNRTSLSPSTSPTPSAPSSPAVNLLFIA